MATDTRSHALTTEGYDLLLFGPHLWYGFRKLPDQGGLVEAFSRESELPRQTIVHEGAAAVARLAMFGLSPIHFQRAAELGDIGASRATKLHPAQAAGQYMWCETVAGLRQQLVALQAGWRLGRTGNYETAFNPDVNMAIAVMGADKYTGVDGGRSPRVKRRRGTITTERVNNNYVQMMLKIHGPAATIIDSSIKPETVRVGAPDEICDLWLMLICAAEGELRMELSLPIGQNEGGFVSEFVERIIIDSIPTVSGVGVTPINPDQGPSDDSQPIDVVRK